MKSALSIKTTLNMDYEKDIRAKFMVYRLTNWMIHHFFDKKLLNEREISLALETYKQNYDFDDFFANSQAYLTITSCNDANSCDNDQPPSKNMNESQKINSTFSWANLFRLSTLLCKISHYKRLIASCCYKWAACLIGYNILNDRYLPEPMYQLVSARNPLRDRVLELWMGYHLFALTSLDFKELEIKRIMCFWHEILLEFDPFSGENW